ncbi:MAG: DUF4168 domain-containing protein, partial [Variibacter sp.]
AHRGHRTSIQRRPVDKAAHHQMIAKGTPNLRIAGVAKCACNEKHVNVQAKEQTMRSFTRLFTATMLIAPWILAGLPASAQAPSAPTPSQQATPSDIPDQKLDAAATVLTRVASIQQDYEKRVTSASASDKKRLTQEANVAMMKAVTDQGMSVDEYNGIIDTAQKVPAVRQKLQQRLSTQKQ